MPSSTTSPKSILARSISNFDSCIWPPFGVAHFDRLYVLRKQSRPGTNQSRNGFAFIVAGTGTPRRASTVGASCS
jgi:hypothetical protein